MSDFEKQYFSRTQKSQALYESARQYLPGGVAGNGKFLTPYPIYVEDARGSKCRDIDGNEYVDLLMGAGIHILGHSPEVVMQAVQDQLYKGVQYYLPAEPEVKLAQKVVELMPSIEMVRFVNTGTEATQMALRAARAYSRREKIAKFEGNFHGQHEAVLVSTLGTNGDGANPVPHIDSAGIPTAVGKDVIILPYNDEERTVALIQEHAHELGAVILETVSAFGLGCVPADLEFLKALRKVTEENDIPLIFDEVVTNFRIALGGAMEYFGVKPDLVCIGKILGGGFAIGGYGGRRDIMEKMVTPSVGIWDLKEQIFQSGSFSGNPISMVAGLAVLEELSRDKEIYPRLQARTKTLCDGITEIGERLGFDILVHQVTSIFQVHFGIDRIRNKRDAMRADKKTANEFHLGMRSKGIMASAHPLFISTAHTDEDTARVLEATEATLTEMKAA